jgi:hypothetical protein
MVNPVDVPRAHRNHDIPSAGFIVYCCRHPVKVGTKPRRTTALGDLASQLTLERMALVCADLASCEDGSYQNLIGPLEAGREFRQKGS